MNRTLEEITRGGARMERKLAAAISTARCCAWTRVVARHGKLPGVRVADTRAEFLRRLGRGYEVRQADERALGLKANPAERALLEQRLT